MDDDKKSELYRQLDIINGKISLAEDIYKDYLKQLTIVKDIGIVIANYKTDLLHAEIELQTLKNNIKDTINLENEKLNILKQL